MPSRHAPSGHLVDRLHSSHESRGVDEGSSSLELVVLFPAVLLLVFGLLQGALWYHARDVAAGAAAAGATAARAETGTAGAGQQRATAFLLQNRDTVLAPQVDASRDGGRVRVTVTGHSLSLLPGVVGPTVEQTVTGPVERFTSEVAP